MNLTTFFRIGENLNLDRKTFVNLRYIAIIGQFFAINIVFFGLKLPFPIKTSLLVIFISLISNFYLQFKNKANPVKRFICWYFLSI